MASQGVTKSGFLTKEGAVRKNWKKRWFVLKGQELAYFKTQVRFLLSEAISDILVCIFLVFVHL